MTTGLPYKLRDSSVKKEDKKESNGQQTITRRKAAMLKKHSISTRQAVKNIKTGKKRGRKPKGQTKTTSKTNVKKNTSRGSSRTNKIINERVTKQEIKDYKCFICNQTINGVPNTFNSHIEDCLYTNYELLSQTDFILKESPPPPEYLPNLDTYEEYTWAGETRIRASTFLEGSLGGGNFTSVKKAKDVDEDLDVDMIEEIQYGETQFSEKDLPRTTSTKSNKNSNENEVLYEHDINDTIQPGTSLPNISRFKSKSDENKAINKDKFSSQKLLIESLKTRIRDLQKQIDITTNKSYGCLVCQDNYDEPLVSVGCWHVHCKECWFRTLSVKKLCPQCQRITFPTELRRIYL